MTTLSAKGAGPLAALSLLSLGGCVRVPVGQINADRMDFGQVIQESWKRQTLLNVVRMRYADVPYKGCWHWIDDADIASKRAFTFLMILFSLAETGSASVNPVVTVPSR